MNSNRQDLGDILILASLLIIPIRPRNLSDTALRPYPTHILPTNQVSGLSQSQDREADMPFKVQSRSQSAKPVNSSRIQTMVYRTFGLDATAARIGSTRPALVSRRNERSKTSTNSIAILANPGSAKQLSFANQLAHIP